MDISTIDPYLLGSVPVVIGLVSVLKTVGLNSKWAPLTSIGLGLVFAFLVGGTPVSIALGGIIVGLMASGLYSGTKTTLAD